MTRKDYLLIAQALKDARTYRLPLIVQRQTHETICKCIARELAADNPNNFDREQFLTNCGVQS